ncbi:hypothetical protein AVEN_29871-1 [Araneus ventricosus]|uniref:Uncharacterized protein n=1 Tax=Araneus ventricosus TaxID=182803 RepID=A0A4Y2WSF5_ARAVE|nr:hypothetical protein AVEN_204944-1 [Araneus ventricosus]GBO39102.1 hypothetical protein AVEN_29871-1 [Araneus ventricosus]
MILVSTYTTQSVHFILLALNLVVQYLLEDHLCLPRQAKIKTSQLNDGAYWFIIIILITSNYLNLLVIAVVPTMKTQHCTKQSGLHTAAISRESLLAMFNEENLFIRMEMSRSLFFGLVRNFA